MVLEVVLKSFTFFSLAACATIFPVRILAKEAILKIQFYEYYFTSLLSLP